MIALDLPTVHDSYSGPATTLHDELFAISETENGAITSLAAVSRTIQDIDDIGTTVQPSEDVPTVLARDVAKRLLSEAQTIAPIYLMPSTIEGSDRDLLIHWETVSKGVVLICPGGENREPQIYKETLEGKRASDSEMTVASPEVLSAALAWVLQPN
jgi:hypothetical protein